MNKKQISQIVFNIVIIAIMVFQAVAPAFASASASLKEGESSSPILPVQVEQPERSATLLQNARGITAAQLRRESPVPVAQRTILPAGTIRTTTPYTHTVFLPLVVQAPQAVELTDLRTRYTKTFQYPDGSGYALAYMNPIHYMSADGLWEDIDNTLISDSTLSGVVRNAANEFTAQFPIDNEGAKALGGDENTLLHLQADGLDVRFALPSAQQLRGVSEQNSITYAGISPGGSLKFYVDNNSISFSYQGITTTQALPAWRIYAAEGNIFSDDQGNLVLESTNGTRWVFASFAETPSENGVTSPTGNETSYMNVPWNVQHISTNVYTAVLQSKNLVFSSMPEHSSPVTIEAIASPTTPAANYSTTEDAYVESGYPGTPTWNQRNLYTGHDVWYGKGTTRTFIRYNMPSLPSNTTISLARAYLYQYSWEGSSSYHARVCRATQDWWSSGARNSLTWYHQPGTTACKNWDLTYRGAGWTYWDITSYARDWYNGTSNHGILLQMQYESSTPASIFWSHNCSSSQCNTAYHPYMLLNYTYGYDPKLSTDLTLNPSTQVPNQNVNASFIIHNYGGQSVSLSLRVTTNGGGDFATVNQTLAGGASYTYSQNRSFGSTGTWSSTCAQMKIGSGSWQNIPANGHAGCRSLSIVLPADVRLSSSLQVTPSVLDSPGGAVRATFSVHNYGTLATTENFRAHETSNTVTFGESGNTTLAGGTSYSYDKTATFAAPGIYEIVAEHYVNGSWTPLLGNNGENGTRIVRVKAPPPPSQDEHKGNSNPGDGNAGEPVNTTTGNYFSAVTDLSEPTPDLPLAVNRWYNAIDADQVAGPFGHGTSWEYGMFIDWRADKSAVVHMGDGHTAYYLGSVNSGNPMDMSGIYAPQGEAQGTLERFADGTATLSMPDQTVYHFNTSGRVDRISTPYPSEITITYSGGHPTHIAHSAGAFFDVTYTGNVITSITSSSGLTVQYAYDANGNLQTVTRPDGSTYTYTYDANHRLTEAHDPNGHTFVRNVYDSQGRVVQQYDQSGQMSAFTYNAPVMMAVPGGMQTVTTRVFTDAAGNTITHTYDSNLNLIAETDALGHATFYTYDSKGNVLTRQDRNGNVWNYTYDGNSNLLSETDPLGNTWTYAYDAKNNRITQTDPLGNTWHYQYDAAGHLTRTTDPVGNTHDYGYDSNGYLIWERDESGALTQYGYNALGLQTVITDALGHATHMTYDAQGNQTSYTDVNGNVSTFGYDSLGRLTTSTDPMGTVITYTYDAMGNLLTESDGMGHLKHYAYDAYDRVISETDFNGNTTQYRYDVLGHMTVMTDTLGNVTTHTYDKTGNLIAEQDALGNTTTYEYDPEGNLLRETDPLGRVTEFVYDAAGRLVETHRPCAVCAGGVAVSQTVYDTAGHVIKEIDPLGAVTRYGYDALGRTAVVTDTYGNVTTYTYNPAGQLLQEVNPLGAVTSYQYDALGRVITTTNALGYQTVNTYDAVGNIIQTTDARGYTTTMTYDGNDRLLTTTDALGNTTTNTYDAAGHLVSVTNPLGYTTIYTYDANGNQISVTDARGNTTVTTYDALNRPVQVTDALGNTSTTVYDALGRVVSKTDALGNTHTYTYDAAGRKTSEQTPLGFVTTYTYDSADNLISRQDADGATWLFEYDAAGNQIRRTDPLGNVYITEYDLLGRQTRTVDPLGGVTQYVYNAAGQLVRKTGPRGALTTYTYDLLGREISETDPLGNTTTFTYDGAGNRLTEQDARGFTTTYVYDALNRQISQTDALGNTRYTLYDAAGHVTSEIDYNGYATTYTYDANGNRLTVTDPLGNTTTTVYDALNRPVQVTDPLGRTRVTTYNALGQVITETTPAGNVTAYAYDADGRQIRRTDALGNAWLTAYDAMGRVVSETDPLGRVTQKTYNALGQLTAETDALNRTTTYTYDPNGRLLSVTGPDGTAQHYTYDAVGNPLSDQDGKGNTTHYEYDLRGSLVRKTDPLGNKWYYRYDETGNLIAVRTPTGHDITTTYDALGRLLTKSYDGVQVLSLTYDANGNRLSMTDATGTTTYVYDARNSLVQSTDPNGRVVQYAYDAAGQQVMLTYPDGVTAQYAYDPDGSLAQVTAPDGGVTTYTYDALGRPVQVLEGNGASVETTYDAAGNTLAIVHKDSGGSVIARYDYTVDAANRRTQKVEILPQGTFTTTYTYDALDRLTDSVASDGRENHYAFDEAGNRTAQWGTRLVNGPPQSYSWTYAYNAANQLLRWNDGLTSQTTYRYDADGNRVSVQSPEQRMTFAYDAENHLTEAHVELWDGQAWAPKNGVYETYIYDGNGRRVEKNTRLAADDSLADGRTYRYDDTSTWNVLQTYAAQEERFLYDGEMHKLAYWDASQSGYFQNDGLGSIIGSTDASGNASVSGSLMRYDDYGTDLGDPAALPTEDGFTGYERDAYTGLQYARNRYYDAETGTFLTQDTFNAQRQSVGGLHRYLYVQANPVNYTDPLGWFRWTSSSSGIIEYGDTLWNIAAQYWGVSPRQVNWRMISAIQRFNPWIKNPGVIYAGYRLRLPSPLSAYQYLANTNSSAVGQGVQPSYCGVKENRRNKQRSNRRSNNNPRRTKNGPPNNKDNGTTTPPSKPKPIRVVDKRRFEWRSWSVYSKYTLNRSRSWHIHHKFPPGGLDKQIPGWLPLLGGKHISIYAEIEFYVENRVKGKIDLTKRYAQIGTCTEVGGSGKLGADLPVSTFVGVELWGKLGGSYEVCEKVKWIPPRTLEWSLEHSGAIYGEAGARLYAHIGGSIGVASASGEIGVEGKVHADFLAREGYWKAGPYVSVSVKAWKWKKEKKWEPFKIQRSFAW